MAGESRSRAEMNDKTGGRTGLEAGRDPMARQNFQQL